MIYIKIKYELLSLSEENEFIIFPSNIRSSLNRGWNGSSYVLRNFFDSGFFIGLVNKVPILIENCKIGYMFKNFVFDSNKTKRNTENYIKVVI